VLKRMSVQAEPCILAGPTYLLKLALDVLDYGPLVQTVFSGSTHTRARLRNRPNADSGATFALRGGQVMDAAFL
jgi:hypothetical protein